MCDLGLALGLAAGAAQVAGQASAASKNQKMVREQTRLEYAAQEREFLVEADASNKDAYQAHLEGERGKSAVAAKGEGMMGNTAAAREAEQGRQSALSIQNAKDRQTAARANYTMAGKHSQIGGQNQINTLQVNPLTAFMNVATSGIQNYGAFK
ncbi:hypothetical protein J1C56_02325 [Aminobacter anthyllidis]|uniref:Uncharacterized protein n=1 Tax=Aminobacter anthyllidis TaxID=1035067 RepID=A0A9X1A7C0_9HYPH|nr:hypothetical protein [Aminobacter anthyllidis]MBT1154421.1 hypothetical protein [Aminobacter anthyllidis]